MASGVVDSVAAHPSLDLQADGTFRVVPRLYQQVLVLFVEANGVVLPAFFVLMTHRTRLLYQMVLLEVSRRLPPPARFMSDWERALRGAAAAVWPAMSLSGCWFHFAQAVLRQVRFSEWGWEVGS